MNPNPNPYHYQGHPPPLPPTPAWYPPVPPNPPPSATFWTNPNFHDRLKELHDTFSFAKSMKKELEALIELKESHGSELSNFLAGSRIDTGAQENISLEAASGLMSRLRFLLEPFRAVVNEKCPWEEKSSVVSLGEKMKKSNRNKLWRKRKRKRVAQMLAKKPEQFDHCDREADEWRAREIAKQTAQKKVQKMKEIAKQKAKEERNKMEAELELVLTVEKLKELRSIRMEKLKKQGHFFPEEDDKFIERVRAAVEEEERQARAAADTDAAKDAIAIAEESRKAVLSVTSDSKDQVREAEKGTDEQIGQSGSNLSSIPSPPSKDEEKEDQIGKVNGCLTMFQAYLKSFIIIIMAVALIWVHLLRSGGPGMHLYNLGEVGSLVTGFNLHHHQMRFGHPILSNRNERLERTKTKENLGILSLAIYRGLAAMGRHIKGIYTLKSWPRSSQTCNLFSA